MVFHTLPFSIPTKHRNLFISNRDIRQRVTGTHSTHFILASNATLFLKSKLTYSGVMLFNSVSDELKMTANFTASSFKVYVHRKIQL